VPPPEAVPRPPVGVTLLESERHGRQTGMGGVGSACPCRSPRPRKREDG
jgi:hypothetical protein